MYISYFTFTIALLVLLCAGLGILFLKNELLRKKSMSWLYLLTGTLAIYCIEKTNYAQPFEHTLLFVAGLWLIPIAIDSILDHNYKYQATNIRRNSIKLVAHKTPDHFEIHQINKLDVFH